ncbi:MAG: ATP-binding cassette domain-containing protein [Frankia sp.]
MTDSPAIAVEGLRKYFGATKALDGIDLQVAEGTVHGLLGPNGAGKTTVVRILTTLLRADSGTARVLGFDAARDAQKLRGAIGVTGQYAAVDEKLTGAENLEMFGRLYRLSARTARARAAELLERFELADAGGRLTQTYSGGMRRRLDLAASLIMQPRVLFLDEPSTGLDPRSRAQVWQVIEDLVRDGTTVLLTTQYLEEADQLAHKITVVDLGKVIAEGTADQLKERVGGARLEVIIARGGDLTATQRVLERFANGDVTTDRDRRSISVPVAAGAGVLPELVRALDEVSVALDDVAVHRPTLDDVFLALTGRPAEATDPDPDLRTGPGAGPDAGPRELVAR